MTLGGLRKKEKKLKTLFFDNFFPGANFGWLYKFDEARVSLEFLHILKYFIQGTRISKIFVLTLPYMGGAPGAPPIRILAVAPVRTL